MCLAIPGQIVALAPGGHFATVEVSKVRRTINIDLLDGEPAAVGEWVLIHVGFAMNRISEEHAAEQLRLLAMLGEDAQAMAELDGYDFGQEKQNGLDRQDPDWQDRQEGQDGQEGHEDSRPASSAPPARPALPAPPDLPAPPARVIP
jgi:hydrogenase expression/formation protein HypC